MAGTSTSPEGKTSDDARKQGNDAFLQGEYRKALDAYTEAAKLALADYRPPWNMSAVYFELGDYVAAATHAKKALELPQDLNGDMRHKIYHRVAKAHILLKEFEEATRYIDLMNDGDDKTSLKKAVRDSLLAIATQQHCWSHAKRSVRNLPQYKPYIDNVPEYFTVGHDRANPMFDVLLHGIVPEEDTLAFLFGGIGDARHFFQTLVPIPRLENAVPRRRKFHFTLNDVKPEVFARDLLFFILLDDLATQLWNDNDEEVADSAQEEQKRIQLPSDAQKSMVTLYFAYISEVMPAQVYDHLQEKIQHAIDALKGSRSLPSWIFLNRSDYPAMITALTSWRADVAKEYTSKHFIDSIVKSRNDKMRMLGAYGMSPDEFDKQTPEEYRAEMRDFRFSGVLLSPHIEPELKAILESDSPKRSETLKAYTESNWMPNVTLVDLAWVRQGVKDFHAEHDPADLGGALYEGGSWPPPKYADRLYDYVEHFFHAVSKGLATIRNRLVVEAISGDITQVMEGIRYGLLNSRDPSYPTKYDRIHLSNIPDYVGGSLFKYIHALPLLKEIPSSFATSVVLRNPPKFPSLEHFNNEYALLNDNKSVEQVFRATASQLEKLEGSLVMDLERFMPGLPRPFSSWDYWVVQHGYLDRELANLKGRAEIEKWLYGLFMKIVLPTHRPAHNDMELVYSPLNISVFFRVLSIVHENGYPAHWLADVLSTILNNEVETTARPPRSYPLSIKETSKNFTNKWMNLDIFLAEFQTLAALWLAELPFGVPIPGDLPSPISIKQYSVRFPSQGWSGETKTPAFVLLFADWKRHSSVADAASSRNLPIDHRKVILPDEKGEKDQIYQEFRENCAIVTTWEWNMKEKKATFWMSEGEVERMKDDDWTIMVLRTDNWRVCTAPEKLDEKLILEDSWVGEGINEDGLLQSLDS